MEGRRQLVGKAIEGQADAEFLLLGRIRLLRVKGVEEDPPPGRSAKVVLRPPRSPADFTCLGRTLPEPSEDVEETRSIDRTEPSTRHAGMRRLNVQVANAPQLLLFLGIGRDG